VSSLSIAALKIRGIILARIIDGILVTRIDGILARTIDGIWQEVGRGLDIRRLGIHLGRRRNW